VTTGQLSVISREPLSGSKDRWSLRRLGGEESGEGERAQRPSVAFVDVDLSDDERVDGLVAADNGDQADLVQQDRGRLSDPKAPLQRGRPSGSAATSTSTPAAPSRVQGSLVHFMPGARTAWHRHPLGQTLFVTEGIGLRQRRGGPVEVIRPVDDGSTSLRRVWLSGDHARATISSATCEARQVVGEPAAPATTLSPSSANTGHG
jgi:hypothetical protein